MAIINVKDLPVVSNICEQVLREIERTSMWSLAHVVMNPMAESILHNHSKMNEIYVITKGYGELGFGTPRLNGWANQVTAGNVFEIPLRMPHILKNKSSGHLEHLVFALPPFNPSDVHIFYENHRAEKVYSLDLPKVQDCFDGAKILSYDFPKFNMSIAFGWVVAGATINKKPHYHKEITEFIYVVEGNGFIEIDQVRQPIQSGNWICINPGKEHSLLNESPEDLVVVCTCFPSFKMEDVYYK